MIAEDKSCTCPFLWCRLQEQGSYCRTQTQPALTQVHQWFVSDDETISECLLFANYYYINMYYTQTINITTYYYGKNNCIQNNKQSKFSIINNDINNSNNSD